MAKKGLGPSSAVLTTLAMLSLMAVVESGKNLLGKGVFTSQPPCQVRMIISTFYVVILVGLFDYEVLRVSFKDAGFVHESLQIETNRIF
jgi:hypothetical protein